MRTTRQNVTPLKRQIEPAREIDPYGNVRVEVTVNERTKRSAYKYAFWVLATMFVIIAVGIASNSWVVRRELRKLIRNQDKRMAEVVEIVKEAPLANLNEQKQITAELRTQVAELSAIKSRLTEEDPRVKKLRSDVRTLDRRLQASEQEKKKALEAIARARMEKADLEDELAVASKKLAMLEGPEREEQLKDILLHLNRRDHEVILLMEKIGVRESGGRTNALGPWVPVRDREGKYKKPPFNPWIKVGDGKTDKKTKQQLKRGVPYDRAYGFTQIMGENIGEWTEEATGIRYTPSQFLADPVAQRTTSIFQIRKLLEKYKNPEDVISVWHSGRPKKKSAKLQDVNGTNTHDYVKEVANSDTVSRHAWENARKEQ